MTRRTLFKSLALTALVNPIKLISAIGKPPKSIGLPDCGTRPSTANYFYSTEAPVGVRVGSVWIFAPTGTVRIWTGKKWHNP